MKLIAKDEQSEMISHISANTFELCQSTENLKSRLKLISNLGP